MERIKINFHPTFIIFACILIYFKQGFLFLNYVLVMFLHEYAHALVAKSLGYNIKNIKLIPFGICLNMNSCILQPKDEIKISIAGPALNFILCLILFSLWWMMPGIYNYTYLFCYANFITGVFNLLPAFPLDGGRILFAFLKVKSSEKFALKFCKLLNIILSCILLFLFILSIFYKINFTYLFVTLCVLSGIIDKNLNMQYAFVNFLNSKKNKHIVKIKSLHIKDDERLYKICKYMNSFTYLNLYIYDKEDNLKAIISETNYYKLLEKSNSNNTFSEVLFHLKKGF